VRGARPGTTLGREERDLLAELPLPLDLARVRIYGARCRRPGSALRRLVLGASRGRAVALGNHVFLPSRCEGDLAVLAHELTHCAQYQAWGPWRYLARGLAVQLRDLLHRKLGLGTSPYVYRLERGKPFDAYGMEQQGQIVEDAFRRVVAGRSIPRRPPG
jgi:Domain of unknown function (DUF4157)